MVVKDNKQSYSIGKVADIIIIVNRPLILDLKTLVKDITIFLSK